MGKIDQAKLVLQARKVQKELAKMVIPIEAGDGAVRIEMTGEQKIKRVQIDPDKIDTDNIGELERWLEDAFRLAISEAQKQAAEKMRPFMGALGDLGL
jgi:DNA-binding YbaB/EbfC family protein